MVPFTNPMAEDKVRSWQAGLTLRLFGRFPLLHWLRVPWHVSLRLDLQQEGERLFLWKRDMNVGFQFRHHENGIGKDAQPQQDSESFCHLDKFRLTRNNRHPRLFQ